MTLAQPVADRPLADFMAGQAADVKIGVELGLWTPRTPLGQVARSAIEHLPPDLARELLYHVRRSVQMESTLRLAHRRGDDYIDGAIRLHGHVIADLGIVSRKMVTDTGVAFIVDAFQNLTEIENLKYHGIGTGAGAEAVGNTALSTELTTQYNPDSTRATGSTTENAANIYRTVGTNLVDSAVSITEHGIFSQAATGGGTLLDKSLFTAVALAIGDSLQSTYDLTLTSGG